MSSLINIFPIVDVADFIKNFKWDDNKYHRGRSLVEIAGLISDVRELQSVNSQIENENH